jgi:hypothetical protein
MDSITLVDGTVLEIWPEGWVRRTGDGRVVDAALREHR